MEYLPDAIDIEIPSREKGRTIPCRLMYPSARKIADDRKKVEGGVICHFHGGGWVVSPVAFSHFQSLDPEFVVRMNDILYACLSMIAVADFIVYSFISR